MMLGTGAPAPGLARRWSSIMTTDVTAAGTPVGPGILARLVRVVACSVLSIAVWLGLVYVAEHVRTCTGEGFQCLGDFIIILFIGLLAAALTVWPLLRLVKVPAAWLAALVGPVLTIGVAAAGAGRGTLASPLLGVAVIAVGYALGALVTERRLPVWSRIAVVAALVAAVVVGFAIR
jgi:hypothetical protein